MEKENFQAIKNLQVWYRISGIGFAMLSFVATLIFFSINQHFVEGPQYTLLVISTILYAVIPTIMSLALSNGTQTPALLEEINQGHNRYRWIEYFFSSSIMMISLGILVGIQSVPILFALAGMMAITILLGSLSDWYKAQWVRLTFFSLSSIVFSLMWVYVFRSFINTQNQGFDLVSSSSTFHQLIIILGLFSIFPLLFVLQHYSGIKIKYTTIDKCYIVAGYVTKTALFFITLMKL